MDMHAYIDRLEEGALQGRPAAREDVLRLLELPSEGEDVRYLGQAARRVARAASQDTGRIWSAIGLDSRPCPKNCAFCSFGEAWGLVREERELSAGEVIAIARRLVAAGAAWVTLRTTEYYGFDRLCALARQIRAAVPGEYELVVNTGQMDEAEVAAMRAAGIGVVYHSLRLGEGVHTCFRPEERLATLRAIGRSPLRLAHLVEPVGPEHSNEELAHVFMTALENGASLSGVMARVNVPGTPGASTAELPEARLAQIAAVTRLCGGLRVPDICVHPASRQAVEWGANVVVVEEGAVPRSDGFCRDVWRGFDVEQARALLREAGYAVRPAASPGGAQGA
ncbi:radical SAM protein [uncultured Desulfovibrio sp.]|uniref:radical SAM protein n=1 Tax=uncultured Desulfovibrio sp. TaxID=167968 RepID=UPI003209E413